jgi:hypothetical protein
MKIKEIQLAAKMLDKASDVFGEYRCNNVKDSFYDGWTLEERQQFVKEMHDWNGDPEEYDPEIIHMPDFAIMSFLAYKLENLNNETKDKLNNKPKFSDIYFEKLNEANKIGITRFCFEYENQIFLVEWSKLKWLDPQLLFKL